MLRSAHLLLRLAPCRLLVLMLLPNLIRWDLQSQHSEWVVKLHLIRTQAAKVQFGCTRRSMMLDGLRGPG